MVCPYKEVVFHGCKGKESEKVHNARGFRMTWIDDSDFWLSRTRIVNVSQQNGDSAGHNNGKKFLPFDAYPFVFAKC